MDGEAPEGGDHATNEELAYYASLSAVLDQDASSISDGSVGDSDAGCLTSDDEGMPCPETRTVDTGSASKPAAKSPSQETTPLPAAPLTSFGPAMLEESMEPFVPFPVDELENRNLCSKNSEPLAVLTVPSKTPLPASPPGPALLGSDRFDSFDGDFGGSDAGSLTSSEEGFPDVGLAIHTTGTISVQSPPMATPAQAPSVAQPTATSSPSKSMELATPAHPAMPKVFVANHNESTAAPTAAPTAASPAALTVAPAANSAAAPSIPPATGETSSMSVPPTPSAALAVGSTAIPAAAASATTATTAVPAATAGSAGFTQPESKPMSQDAADQSLSSTENQDRILLDCEANQENASVPGASTGSPHAEIGNMVAPSTLSGEMLKTSAVCPALAEPLEARQDTAGQPDTKAFPDRTRGVFNETANTDTSGAAMEVELDGATSDSGDSSSDDEADLRRRLEAIAALECATPIETAENDKVVPTGAEVPRDEGLTVNHQTADEFVDDSLSMDVEVASPAAHEDEDVNHLVAQAEEVMAAVDAELTAAVEAELRDVPALPKAPSNAAPEALDGELTAAVDEEVRAALDLQGEVEVAEAGKDLTAAVDAELRADAVSMPRQSDSTALTDSNVDFPQAAVQQSVVEAGKTNTDDHSELQVPEIAHGAAGGEHQSEDSDDEVLPAASESVALVAAEDDDEDDELLDVLPATTDSATAGGAEEEMEVIPVSSLPAPTAVATVRNAPQACDTELHDTTSTSPLPTAPAQVCMVPTDHQPPCSDDGKDARAAGPVQPVEQNNQRLVVELNPPPPWSSRAATSGPVAGSSPATTTPTRTSGPVVEILAPQVPEVPKPVLQDFVDEAGLINKTQLQPMYSLLLQALLPQANATVQGRGGEDDATEPSSISGDDDDEEEAVAGLHRGAEVLVEGLRSMQHLNGCLGTLGEFDAATGRWQVHIRLPGNKVQTRILRPQFLTARAPAWQAGAKETPAPRQTDDKDAELDANEIAAQALKAELSGDDARAQELNAKLQQLRPSVRGAKAPGGSTSNFEVAVEETLDVPIDAVGGVIGRGGDNIRRMSEQSGARLSFEKYLPGSSTRRLSARGTTTAIATAWSLVREAILQATRKSTLPADASGGACGSAGILQGVCVWYAAGFCRRPAQGGCCPSGVHDNVVAQRTEASWVGEAPATGSTSPARRPMLVVLSSRGGGEQKDDVVELSALALCSVTGRELGRYHRFTRPFRWEIEADKMQRDFPALCFNAGSNAIPVVHAVTNLQRWIAQVLVVPPEALSTEDFLIVTCGDGTMKTALPRQCCMPLQTNMAGLGAVDASALRLLLCRWCNLKEAFREHYQLAEAPAGVRIMLKHLKLPFAGHRELGMDDAINLGRIVRYLCSQGYTWRATSRAPALAALGPPANQLSASQDIAISNHSREASRLTSPGGPLPKYAPLLAPPLLAPPPPQALAAQSKHGMLAPPMQLDGLGSSPMGRKRRAEEMPGLLPKTSPPKAPRLSQAPSTNAAFSIGTMPFASGDAECSANAGLESAAIHPWAFSTPASGFRGDGGLALLAPEAATCAIPSESSVTADVQIHPCASPQLTEDLLMHHQEPSADLLPLLGVDEDMDDSIPDYSVNPPSPSKAPKLVELLASMLAPQPEAGEES